MKNFTLYLFTFLSVFCIGKPVHAQDDYSPRITIEKAIQEARKYADKNKINLTGKYINKVKYYNNMQNQSKQSYWMILWINTFVTKGGGVELRLYEDGSFKERYHK